jgi:hypothetical protein
VEEAQGDPAGVEGRVDLSLGRVGPDGLVADFKSKSRLVEVEERAGDHLPLAPPSIRIDDGGAIVRREAQHDRRLVDAPRAAGVLDPGEQETGIVTQSLGNRSDHRGAKRRASRRDAGLGERQDVGTGKRRSAGASAKVTGVEQAVGPISVVGLGERRAEFAQDDALRQGVEIPVTPQGAYDLRRLLGAAHHLRRARRGDLARARLRRLTGEICGDLRGQQRMRNEIGFLPLANPATAWPARVRLKEGGERREGRMRVGA